MVNGFFFSRGGVRKFSSDLIGLRRKDYFFLLFIGIFSLIAFVNARDDFSYDYIHYIKYFNELGGTAFGDLIEGVFESFPVPYVIIPPTGYFELGFGFLVWVLMQVFDSASLVYAIIGSASIFVRCWILRRMGLGWVWLIVINVYAVTLFEANAIRLGCAVTLFLYGLLLIRQGRSLAIIGGVFFLSCLFHLQLFFQILFFAIVFFGSGLVVKSKFRLSCYILIILLGCIFIKKYQDFLGFGKYGDYVGVLALAGGLNVVTFLALMAIMLFLARIFLQPVDIYVGLIDDRGAMIGVAITMAAVPALVVYLLFSDMGALGDRIWQMAFTILASVTFAKKSELKRNPLEVVVFVLLIAVANINIIYRYPLSNFFYPLVPYVEIDPTFKIL